MMKNIFVLVALLLGAGLYTVLAHDTVPQQVRRQAAKDLPPAPAFRFAALTGGDRALEDFRGRAVVLNFWASWCAPCIVEFPQMIRLAESKKNTMFLFLGVGETREAAQKFAARHLPPNLPENVMIGLDTDKTVSEKIFKTYKLPETYLITASHRIQGKIIGNSVDWEGEEMSGKINGLSAESGTGRPVIP